MLEPERYASKTGSLFIVIAKSDAISKILVELFIVNDDVNVVPSTTTPKLPISVAETTPIKEIEKVSKFS